MMKRVEKWWNDYLTRNKISGVIALEEARKAYRTGLIRGKGEAVYVAK